MRKIVWMMAAILTCSLAMTGMTSCRDNEDNNGATPVPSPVSKQLTGNWIVDLDCDSTIDMGFVTLQFREDSHAQIGMVVYDYDADAYQQVNVEGSVRTLDDMVIEEEGLRVAQLEFTADRASLAAVGLDEPMYQDPDTLYFSIGDEATVFYTSGVICKSDDYDNDGQIETFGDKLKAGVLDLNALNKQATREFVEKMMYMNGYKEDLGPDDANAKSVNRAVSVSMSRWMKKVADKTKVRNLIIPGTHDTGTFGMGGDWNLTLGMTQRKNLEGQWNCGIRYFDFRTRYRQAEKTDMIFHSMLDCKVSLDQMLDNIVTLLEKYKESEGCVVSIKCENNDLAKENQDSKIEEALNKYIPGLDKIDKGAYKFLQYAADMGVFKFDFTKLERRTTEERAIELVTQKLYANGLLAKWTPEMTMNDLRGKAIVIFQGFPKDLGYGNLRDYVVLTDETNMKLTTPSGSASAGYVEQNQWEVGDNRTYDKYISDKTSDFRKKITESLKDDGKWYFNAANGYEFECKIIPNYAKVAESAYPSFINSIKENPGCRGLMVLDYAGDNSINRVSVYKLAGSVVGAGVGAVLDGIRSVFTKKSGNLPRRAFEVTYGALAKITSDYRNASQSLVQEMVDGNFAKAEFDPNRISPLDGTNPNSASDPERFACLFDDDPNTKWCVSEWYTQGLFPPYWWVAFKTSEPFTAKSYTLFSAYDTGKYPRRNPMEWKLLAANGSDKPVVIDSRNADKNGADGIPAENYKGKTYTIQHPGKYQYYALQIFDNWGDRYMQLGGFRFEEWEK